MPRLIVRLHRDIKDQLRWRSRVDYLYLLRLERRGQQEFLPEKADRDYNVKELLNGIKPEKARQKDLEQFFKEGKLEIIVQPPPPPPPVKDPKPKGFWQKTLRLGKAIAAVIGILAVLLGAAAALFALLDINDLFGK
jgi:hypothetical protein